jgi:hypothetical protein
VGGGRGGSQSFVVQLRRVIGRGESTSSMKVQRRGGSYPFFMLVRGLEVQLEGGGRAVNSFIGRKARVGSQPYLIIQCTIVRRGNQPGISRPVERSEGKGAQLLIQYEGRGPQPSASFRGTRGGGGDFFLR